MQLGDCLCKFIKFVKEVDMKGRDENISPRFKCRYLDISIVLVGRPETVQYYGCEPYTSYIKGAVKEGIQVFYILARGRLNCWVADEVAYQLCKEKIVKKTKEYSDEVTHKGKQVKISCIRLENSSLTCDPFKDYLQTY